MKKINLISLAVVLMSGLVLLNSAFADTLYVPTQYPTIQAAIDAANPGDTVMVLPGTYEINDQINVNKDLTIKSEAGPESAILLATTNLSSSEYVFLIMTGTTSATTIEGFTISPATPDSTSYNGFKCQPSTAPTIKNNVIERSIIPYGIGIYVYNAQPVINNNAISGFNAGISLENYASSEITNCIIHNNNWGIFFWNLSSAEIRNCIVNNNNYAITVNNSSAEIVNCAVVYNAYSGLMIDLGGHVTSLKNSIVYGNDVTVSQPYGAGNFYYGDPDSVTYSNIGGASLYPGTGNINVVPLFINPALYNYHLQLGSPCIDAGDPDPIYNDPEDPANPGMALYPALGEVTNDMGAYGGPLSLSSLLSPATLIVPTQQYPTIQAAIDAANPGDTVMVLPGEYPIDEQIGVDKDLTIKSQAGAEDTTLLATTNLSSSEYVFLIMTGTTSATTIEGFTISPATPSSTSFLGIGCQTGASPTIRNNVIQGTGTNTCGIYVNASHATSVIKNNVIIGFTDGIKLLPGSSSEITNCIIHNNYCGIFELSNTSGAPPSTKIADCIIYNNDIGMSLAVSWLTGPLVANIVNCIIHNNGWGIYISGSWLGSHAGLIRILNCTIVYNTIGGVAIGSGAHVILKNNIVYANDVTASQPYGAVNLYYGVPESVTYSNIGGASLYPGDGNINVNPLFIDPDNRDYHLQLTSLCIDAGDPNPIYNDPEDPANPGMALYPALGEVTNDMGAYGGSSILISSSYPPASATLIVPTQYPTIQAAIDAAFSGDTVLVLPGEYPIDEQIGVDKDLTIKSQAGAEDTTLLATTNLSSSEYVFLIMAGTASATTIDGFTISSATPDRTPWNGFKCLPGTQPTIKNNVIQANGHGIYASNSAHPLIDNNVISGGSIGIYLATAGSAEITNTIVHDSNYGIYLYIASAQISNTIFHNNNYGVNISYYSAAQMANCAVIYNGYGITRDSYYATSLSNSIVYDNTQNVVSGAYLLTTTYSDIGGASVYPGTGNINADPLFVDVTNNDYHLQLGSPCIDFGNPDPIYNDPEDPANPGMALYPALGTTRNDMGVYGGPGIIIE